MRGPRRPTVLQDDDDRVHGSDPRASGGDGEGYGCINVFASEWHHGGTVVFMPMNYFTTLTWNALTSWISDGRRRRRWYRRTRRPRRLVHAATGRTHTYFTLWMKSTCATCTSWNRRLMCSYVIFYVASSNNAISVIKIEHFIYKFVFFSRHISRVQCVKPYTRGRMSVSPVARCCWSSIKNICLCENLFHDIAISSS